jgi:hypothetical protein
MGNRSRTCVAVAATVLALSVAAPSAWPDRRYAQGAAPTSETPKEAPKETPKENPKENPAPGA